MHIEILSIYKDRNSNKEESRDLIFFIDLKF